MNGPIEPCESHFLMECKICANAKNEIVFMTTGSSLTFHAKRHCNALKHGQKLVKRSGGEPAPIIALHRKQAVNNGKQQCQVCFK